MSERMSKAALREENVELRARLAEMVGPFDLSPKDPRRAVYLDPRIETAQVAMRKARATLLKIAGATGSLDLTYVSEDVAKAHDGLYTINRELCRLRAGARQGDSA